MAGERSVTGRPQSPVDLKRIDDSFRKGIESMNGKGMVQRIFMVLDEDAEARRRRKRNRSIPGIERQEDRVVLSHMGMPGGPGGGMMTEDAQFEPILGEVASSCDMATCEVTMLPVMPAGAQIMGSLAEAGVLGGHKRGPIGPDGSAPTSDDPAIQTLLDKLTAALNQQKTDAESIAAKSNLTVAALDALHEAFAGLDVQGLALDKTVADAAVSSLVRAVAGQTETTEAAAAFTALFEDSGVSQAAIDTAISAITKLVNESNLTVGDLDTLKADRAAVDASFQALRDAGYEPFPVAARSGVAFGGEPGVRARAGRPRKIVPSGTASGDTTKKVTTTNSGSTSNESTKIRRVPGNGLARAGRFAVRGIAGRRGFGARF